MSIKDGDGVVRGGQATGGRLLTARGQRTRANLVAAAAEIFEIVPFADARLSDITSRAGVSAGTFYTYFDSKEQIFREVARAVLAEMSDAGRFDTEQLVDDPIGAVADATRRYFLTCLEHAGVARSMEQVSSHDAEVGRSRRGTVIVGVKRLDRWIRGLQVSGVCDDAIDSWDTAMVLHTMTVRVAYDHLLLGGEDNDVEPLVDAVTHVWARTVGLERAAGRTQQP